MLFSLSTHWNAARHASGETLIGEILELGFRSVELGYDLRMDLVEGVRRMVGEGAVAVSSLHNFCPVPAGAPRGHPELFDLSSRDGNVRAAAVEHTTRTIRFAASLGADKVVAHAGNVDMKHYTRDLVERAERGASFDARYERIKDKLLLTRQRLAPPHLDQLARSVEELLPELQSSRVKLCFENLPSWESIPTEIEAQALLARFDTPLLGCWHDFGHAQIRENLGFISHLHWLRKLSPRVGGFHVHDVAPPAMDHVMPPDGSIDFTVFRTLIRPEQALVIEPLPNTPPDRILRGLAAFRAAWETPPVPAPGEPAP